MVLGASVGDHGRLVVGAGNPPTPRRFCLIVDNPLRDLEGLVLVAWHLARAGHEAYLIPMYDQVFDVPAIEPDVILANYFRPNNADLLRFYRTGGAKVVVLDTEGVAGGTPAAFAKLVASTGGLDTVDAYCVWGQDRGDALIQTGAIQPDRVRPTGCPRYDFCAPAWRPALRSPASEPGYVLVNTNFCSVNPRFATGGTGDRQAMLSVGLDEDYVDRFIADNRRAMDGMISLLEQLLRRFEYRRFILRPHPFENGEAYNCLKRFPNFEIRQEGTSLEWIDKSAVLIHLNCSTAIEARMLDRLALSPGWLNTATLKQQGPTAASIVATSLDEMADMVEAATYATRTPLTPGEIETLLNNDYGPIDGQSGKRVADILIDLATGQSTNQSDDSIRFPVRLKQLLRRLAGASFSSKIESRFRPKLTAIRRAKAISLPAVQEVLARLAQAAGASQIEATWTTAASQGIAIPRMVSGRAVLVRRSESIRDV